MASQPFVDVRVVGVEQRRHAAVLRQCAGHEPDHLFPERVEQAFVVVGVADRIHDDIAQAPQIEPLRREVLGDRRAGARVGQHPSHLLFQNVRIVEASLHGQLQQRLVGQAAPEKERQARRKLQIAQPIRFPVRITAVGIAVDPQQEFGVDEDSLNGELNARFKAASLGATPRRRTAATPRRPCP